MSMIKTALKKGTPVRLDSLPSRELPPDGIRLRVEACGICGTDLHVAPESADRESPFGHEIAGTITGIGSAVTGLETGQRVILESCSACGKCEVCRNTQQELCTGLQSFFFGVPSFGRAFGWRLCA